MERSVSRQVSINSPAASGGSAAPAGVRVVTLNERFSQIGSGAAAPSTVTRVIPASSSSPSSASRPVSSSLSPSSVRSNPHLEAGMRARRQATEIRQIAQRNEQVVSARARPAASATASSTWTPTFYDDGGDDDDDYDDRVPSAGRRVARPTVVSSHVIANDVDDDYYDDDAAVESIATSSRAGRRRIEIDGGVQREPEFVIKGIPPAQPRAPAARPHQRTIVMDQPRYPAQQTRYQPPPQQYRGAARGGRGGSDRMVSMARGGAVGRQQQTRGGYAGRGASSRSAQAVPGLQTESRGLRGRGRGGSTMTAPRGGRGGGGRGGRGGRGGAAKPASKHDLDAELDSYMLRDATSAKSYLDQELNEYMRVREQEGDTA